MCSIRGGDGFACRGKRYIGVRGLSVPFKAHSHMCWPLLEHMSAMVVTPSGSVVHKLITGVVYFVTGR